MKNTLWLILVAAVIMVAPVYAFHDGGVAECNGCHSMHSAVSYPLQIGVDAGSTCLNCHESPGDTAPTRYHISTAQADLGTQTARVVQMTPGGDFGWLRRTFSAPASYSAYAIITNYGYQRGHNIQAAGNQYTVIDGSTSPGGSFPSNQLTCSSCHDPHSQARQIYNGASLEIQYPQIGQTHAPIFDSGSYGAEPVGDTQAVGVYRLLAGATYSPTGGAIYPGAPTAIVDSDYNRYESKADPTRVAYGRATADGYATWGEWCATCHADMHDDSGILTHNTDSALSGRFVNYNAYVMTGDLTGTSTDSFTSLVPFASNTNDIPTLFALTGEVTGVTAGDFLSCFACHRAHTSGWKHALRWNNEAEFLTLGDAGSGAIYPGVELSGTIGNQGQFNQGYTSDQMQDAYVGRLAGDEFAPHQRSLCNKCHLKD